MLCFSFLVFHVQKVHNYYLPFLNLENYIDKNIENNVLAKQ